MDAKPKVKCDQCGKEYAKSYIKRHVADVHGTGKHDRKKAEEARATEIRSAAVEILSRPTYRIPPGEEVTDEQLNKFLEDVEFIDAIPSDGELRAMSISGDDPRNSLAANAPVTPKTRIRQQPELAVQKKMEKRLGGSHKQTPAGIIDIWTETTICEIKEWRSWKDALGQLLAYAWYYRNHMLHAHFFGPVPPDEFRLMVITILTQYHIKVSWEGQNGKR